MPYSFNIRPKCMCLLLFAIENLARFRKSLICIRPVDRLAGRGLMGLRTRRGLISRKVDDDHLGRQALGAYFLRSMLSSLSRTPWWP